MMHVVMFSGGIGSWATAKRVALQHGTADLVLLFADTKAEEADVYRFRDEAAANVGGQLVVVADGRDPWQVFHDTRFLGNSRVAKCSIELKQKPCAEWLAANAPAETTIYVGIDWSEGHRIPAIRKGYAGQGYAVEFPMCDRPYLDKRQMIAWAAREGLRAPVAYVEGFPHANCAGACVKGGMAQWALLWEKHPDRYAVMERNEAYLRDHLGKDVAILRDRTGGETRPMTLREFRVERLEPAGKQGDMFDGDEWGGCGCLPEEAA